MSHQVKKKTSSPLLLPMKNHHYLTLLYASWLKVTLRYVRKIMIVMMSLIQMNLLTSSMSTHPSLRGKKSKVKVLESTHAKLELAHSDMLVKYNDLLEKHNESLVLAKQVEESHKKLKQEHRKLAHKYQEFEFAYEAIDPSLENSIYENVVRSMLLPHVMTCSLMTMLLMSCPSLSPLGKRNEDDLPRLHLAPPWHPKWMKMKKKMIHHHKRVFQRQHRKYKIDMSQVFHYKCKSSMIHLNKHPRMYH